MPEVTVVVPTYNRAELLPRAIESVIAQTHDDLELVVVDDGSTDGTESVVRAHDDDRIRYVAHDANRGANAARNTGIEEAEGEYVAFLDSDDEWHPEKLARQLDRLDGDHVGAYCDAETRAEGPGRRLLSLAARVLAYADDPAPHEGGEPLADEILAGNVHPGAGSTLLVRTDVARRVGGWDEALDRFQDPEFVLRILEEEGPLAYVDAPLVVRHPTGSPPADTVRDADERYLDKYAEGIERAEDRGHDVRGTHALILAKAYLAEGRPLAASHYLRHATVPFRHVPGLLWAAANGTRRRGGAAIGVTAAGILVWLFLYVRR